MKAHIKNYLDYYNIGEQDVVDCEYCGKQARINNGHQIHHIVFKSQGGKDNIENLMCLCFNCHDRAHFHCLPSEKLTKSELTEIHKRNL